MKTCFTLHASRALQNKTRQGHIALSRLTSSKEASHQLPQTKGKRAAFLGVTSQRSDIQEEATTHRFHKTVLRGSTVQSCVVRDVIRLNRVQSVT